MRPHRLWLDGVEGAMLSFHGERFAMERNDKTAVGIAHEKWEREQTRIRETWLFLKSCARDWLHKQDVEAERLDKVREDILARKRAHRQRIEDAEEARKKAFIDDPEEARKQSVEGLIEEAPSSTFTDAELEAMIE